ncbi:MAG: extracellular solute-binding protein, partial [Propionibacteriaceae bacterium]|nr:extracellular solute-binding protein [Propionibacteriaceae bacterium]
MPPAQARLRRWVTALLAAGLVSLGLSACSGSSGSDRPSGALTVACAGPESWCQELVNAFQSKTGVETSFVLTSGEPAAGQAGVWHGASGSTLAQASARLEAYRSPQANDLPTAVKSADGRWTGVSADPIGFCSNRTILDELGLALPQSWDELLQPQLTGQIVLAHPSQSATSYQALWSLSQLRGQAQGAIDYMRSLDPAVLRYVGDDQAGLTAVQSGQAAVTVALASACSQAATDRPDLTWTPADEGVAVELTGVAVLAGAANPKAAQAYVDWALTAEAQNLALGQGDHRLPTCPQAELVASLPPLRLRK